MIEKNYRTDINGLRAVCVLAVILFVFNHAWLTGGFVRVDVLLVISSYLIAKILLGKKGATKLPPGSYGARFYVCRLQLIAPAYFVMLVLVYLLRAILFLPQDLDIYKKA